jgi:hypothetical protein
MGILGGMPKSKLTKTAAEGATKLVTHNLLESSVVFQKFKQILHSHTHSSHTDSFKKKKLKSLLGA